MAWSTDDWQEYNMSLAAQFHRGSFQTIPDNHGGDGGLEGFSKDDLAVGYQCYVPEEDAESSFATRILRKINSDTLKLKKNAVFFSKCLDAIKLKRWTLIIPAEYLKDNQLTQHVGVRTGEVRSWDLSFIDKQFTITVGSGAEFDGVRDRCREFGRKRINILTEPPTDTEQKEWELANEPKMQLLDDKLGKSKRPRLAISAIRSALVRNAVIAQNAFNRIEKEDPEGWERLVKTKSEKRDALELESALNTAIPAEFITKVKAEYQARALEVMPALTEAAARILADEAIVEWLFACPLNFFESESDGK
ncbi:MAG: hypothetical protein V4672_21195 [Verrucomicrobiota bacterium]